MRKYQVQIFLMCAVCLLLGVFAGTKFQASKSPLLSNGYRNQFTQNSQRGNLSGGMMANRGGQIQGTILSEDANSLTVKLLDGSSKIIVLTEKTSINKATEGTKSDLTVGARVGVFGATNADGSVTATNIQLNPTFRGATPSAIPTK